MKLNELIENPDNPSKCTEEQIERLAGKLKRVPLGLTAQRIAYVIDDESQTKMVISGNKRLRVLKKLYGEDSELPDDYFQDVSEMSEAERHEFIITANTSDGEWDVDKLIEQYDRGELDELLDSKEVIEIFGEKNEWDTMEDITSDIPTPPEAKPKRVIRIIIPEEIMSQTDEIEGIVRDVIISKYPQCEV